MGSVKKAFDLSGRSALVTGGSRGLGPQIAEALGEQELLSKHPAGLGIKANSIAADESRDDDIERLANR
jgi:NAD(P)-dependent dehydrogenase (short-subunit alcohol dehydrogenase family)